jgi:hypothetical protein
MAVTKCTFLLLDARQCRLGQRTVALKPGACRLISRWAVMHVYDAAGNAKSPIERGLKFKDRWAVQ